jgi:hypothetical protein
MDKGICSIYGIVDLKELLIENAYTNKTLVIRRVAQ